MFPVDYRHATLSLWKNSLPASERLFGAQNDVGLLAQARLRLLIWPWKNNQDEPISFDLSVLRSSEQSGLNAALGDIASDLSEFAKK